MQFETNILPSYLLTITNGAHSYILFYFALIPQAIRLANFFRLFHVLLWLFIIEPKLLT